MALPGQPPGVNNTAFLFGMVVLAFVIWVTAKGDLPKWLGLLGLGQTTAAASPSGTPSNGLSGLPAIPSIAQTNSAFGGAQSDSAASAPTLPALGGTQ